MASLEVKISELSETVGSYVLLREQDQVTMEKLKERIGQLDTENTELTKGHVERSVAPLVDGTVVGCPIDGRDGVGEGYNFRVLSIYADKNREIKLKGRL